MAAPTAEQMEAGTFNKGFQPQPPFPQATTGTTPPRPAVYSKPVYEVEERRGLHWDWLCFGE